MDVPFCSLAFTVRAGHGQTTALSEDTRQKMKMKRVQVTEKTNRRPASKSSHEERPNGSKVQRPTILGKKRDRQEQHHGQMYECSSIFTHSFTCNSLPHAEGKKDLYHAFSYTGFMVLTQGDVVNITPTNFTSKNIFWYPI